MNYSVLIDNTEVECEVLATSVETVRRFLDTGEMPSDTETALDKAQGDARIKGEPQYLLVVVSP